MSTLITGVFDNRMDAERAVEALTQRGVGREHISLLVNEQAQPALSQPEHDDPDHRRQQGGRGSRHRRGCAGFFTLISMPKSPQGGFWDDFQRSADTAESGVCARPQSRFQK